MPVARQSSAPLGVVYTPPDVARAMVEFALAPLLAKSRDVLALRICDPAAGEGVFLHAVIDVLARHAPRHAVMTECIYGVDVDARAVRKAALPNVRVANALDTEWPSKFDLVIGNPPYIRQEHLQGKAALRGFESYDGVADLYVYFIELAHRIAKPGGRYCFITPNKWLTVAYGRPLRRFLARERSVEGVVDLASVPVFDVDAFPSIVWGTIGGAPETRAQRITTRDELPAALRGGAVHRWTDDEPWHIDAPGDRATLERIAKWPKLGELIGRPSRGIVTGCNRVFVISGATRARLLDEDPACAPLIRPFLKGRDIRRWRAAPDDRYILLVDRGTVLPKAIESYLAPHRAALEPGSGRKPGTYKWYELQDPVGELSASTAPRLFFQDIQSGPACCLDETGLVPDTTVWTLPTADRYLLAVLNSSLYGWYAQRRFPPALNGSVRPKLEYIRAFPIATPSEKQRTEISQLVEQALAGRTIDREIDQAVLDVYKVGSAIVKRS